MHSTYKLNHGGVGGDMEGREEAGEKRGRGEAGEKRGREEAGENPDATTSLQGMSACLNPKP